MSNKTTFILPKQKKYKAICIILLLCFFLPNITACDYVSSKLYPDFRAKQEKSIVEKPPFAYQNAPKNISIEKVRKDSKNIKQAQVVPTVKNGLGNIKPTAGLFTKIGSTEERLSRLENHVQRISDTIEKMSPAITKLSGIENEMDSLSAQLDALIKEENLTSVKQTKTISYSNVQKQNAHIQKIRLGDHTGKTRIVLETNEKINYKIEKSDNGNSVILSLPKNESDLPLSRIARQSNIVNSINRNDENEMTVLSFNLERSIQNIKKSRIPPSAELSKHRIVLDLEY